MRSLEGSPAAEARHRAVLHACRDAQRWPHAAAACRSCSRSRRWGVSSRRVACPAALTQPGVGHTHYSVVHKFGGSSVRDADRMREVASIVSSFGDHLPVVVLSAMGKTTNTLLAAGEAALRCEGGEIEGLEALATVRELHRDTVTALRLRADDAADVEVLLRQLAQLLTGVSLMQELTPRTSANLVSFGERLATRIFAAYLRAQGVEARQYDSFGPLGLVSTDDFGSGDVLPASYANIRAVLSPAPRCEVAVVTGFLARGAKSGAITTLGRGGSDLSCTVLGRALGVQEVWIWKDVDGVLSADPRICPSAVPLAHLSFDEASELAYFGAQAPAMSSETPLDVRVRNSYNTAAQGTLISRSAPASPAAGRPRGLLTSIVRKADVTLLDIVSTRMLGQSGFLAQVFAIMAQREVSVDVVATSEVSVSLTLDPARLWSRALAAAELAQLADDFGRIADVTVSPGHSVLSLIGDTSSDTGALCRVFKALGRAGCRVRMISQGASKVNIQLLVDDASADDAVRAVHAEFFE